jgi:hypothetical protein
MTQRIPKAQVDQRWVVTSGARILPVSLRERVVSAQPMPRRVPRRVRVRRDSPSRLTLTPLSRRAAIVDR